MTRSYTINFTGDVMLGRLVDQLFPVHVDERSDADTISSFTRKHHELRAYKASSPWGSMLPLFRSADLNIINLETAVTTHDVKWPDKVFNYRMHPENISALYAARIDYVSLANNHTLDFSLPGLEETIRTLRQANISFAGVGDSHTQAIAPAIVTLPRPSEDRADRTRKIKEHQIHVYSASDHPSDWVSIPQFHLVDYSAQTRQRLKAQLTSKPSDSPALALKVCSIHWGPNYAWHPTQQIKELAHFLIDECDVDIIHGHSSHHIQPIELYKGKLIMYGCGDFVDDYAVDRHYRNDLSALWRVTVEDLEEAGTGKLKLAKLEFIPNRIKLFQAGRLDRNDPADYLDYMWVRQKFLELCRDTGMQVEEKIGEEGQLVVDIG